MTITNVKIKNFLAFNGTFTANFCKGVNVLIGGNGTGKTTLMKCMYDVKPADFVPGTHDIFYNNTETEWGMISADGTIIGVSFVYIPEKDILEHAKGLLPFIDQKENDFGHIYRDVLITAQDSNTKEQSITQKTVSEIICGKIGGKVEWVPSKGRYYTIRTDGTRIPFSNEASGFKKLGYLELLVRTGRLESGYVLFWDEPENSLHPNLIPTLVKILFVLQKSGVQVFLATHSDYLCKWLEMLSSDDESYDVEFISLFRERDAIHCESSKSYRNLVHNEIIEQSVELYNEHMRRIVDDED